MSDGADTWVDVRNGYDALADDYAAYYREDLANAPLTRGFLGAYAELVRRDGGGHVLEVGCGPGRIAAHLADLGLDVSGADLAPRMIAIARESHPELRFTVGTMTEIDVRSASLAGVVAWYSIIHLTPDQRARAFDEFRRVLRPDGHLLLAFQVGEEVVHREELGGHRVAIDFHRLRPETIARELDRAGFEIVAQLVREPEGLESPGHQAHLLARARHRVG